MLLHEMNLFSNNEIEKRIKSLLVSDSQVRSSSVQAREVKRTQEALGRAFGCTVTRKPPSCVAGIKSSEQQPA